MKVFFGSFREFCTYARTDRFCSLSPVASQTLQVNNAAIVSQSYGYDAVKGRLDSATDSGQGVAVAYGYTANSNILNSTTTSLGGTARLAVARGTDGLGRLSSNFTSIPNVAVTEGHAYRYDGRARRDRDTLANGLKWSYAYNDRNEVTGGEHQLADGTAIPGRQYGYAFDAIGNRTSGSVNGRTGGYERH